MTTATKERHPKQNPAVRCCWICGKPGGAGFTHALRWMGYRMESGEMGYAHPVCVKIEKQRDVAHQHHRENR